MFGRKPLSRETAIDLFCDAVNGLNQDPNRRGYMSRARAASTLDMWKAAMADPMSLTDAPDHMVKSVTVSTGLTYYDLSAPAMNMFPTVTPVRNMLQRRPQVYAGDKFNYESVTKTTGSGLPTMGWVPEGQRAASMSYTTTRVSVTYASFGEENDITQEALRAADGFEDESSLIQLRAMLRLMFKEEMGLLGGNNSLALGTPVTPTVTASGTGGSIAAGTYSTKVVALTVEGFQNASVTNGVTQSLTITGNDGQTYTLNGGSSAISTATSVVVASGQNILASTTGLNGAAAYAWYVGASGSEHLQAVTTINSVVLSSLSTTTQLASAVTTDHSTNTTAFDGLMTTAWNQSAAYTSILATGTAGTGTSLTASTRGGSNEVDTMLESMWNTSYVSPTVLYGGTSTVGGLSDLVLSAATSPLMRYFQTIDGGAPDFRLTQQGVTAWYFNPFTADGGMKIQVRAHPYMGGGTLFAWSELLPPWYLTNELPSSAFVATRQDYYLEVWPRTTRKQYYGMYAQEALAVPAPFALGVISNIAGA